ncbi:MAG: YgiT-type zinc finger protein [Mycobacteriales bacterium]
MTGCADCGNGQRRAERRAKVAELDGRTALVLGVPVEVCDACGRVWLSFEIATRLDDMFTSMLGSEIELATRHFDTSCSSAA